jgi:gluconolactonase
VAVFVPALTAAAQPLGEYLVEKVAGGFRAARGAVWAPNGYLVICDPPQGKGYVLNPGQRPQILQESTGKLSAAAYDETGRLYLADPESRRVLRLEPNGQFLTLAQTYEEKPLNGPFSLAVRKDAHVYFTDPAFGAADDRKTQPFYGVFHVTPKRELNLVYRSAQRPGGIALAPSGRTLYVAGADERVIRAWDVDRSGRTSNERVLISRIQGVPNGLATDAKGNLWVAANQLLQYSPDGRLLKEIPLPETPTSIAIAEPGDPVLYVTTRVAVYRLARQPASAKGTEPR